MKYLLDTITFLFFIKGSQQDLSKRTIKILSDSNNQFILSTVSLWEISIKYSLKKLPLAKEPGEWLIDLIYKMGWESLSISPQHAVLVSKLPYHHKDPFDRLLIAQAQHEKVTIITPDKIFKKYKVKTIW